MMRLNKRIIVGIVFLAFVAVGGVYAALDHNKVVIIKQGFVQFVPAVTHWRERIRESGAPVAREEMIKLGAPLSISSAHYLTHSFGEALLEEQGLEGLKYCDGSYMGGCYDQFMGHAISLYGMSAVPNLIKVCDLEGHNTCRHGIGHGIMSHFGTSEADLAEALAYCFKIDAKRKCIQIRFGILMEYFLQEMPGGVAGTTSKSVLQMTDANRYGPCENVGSLVKRPCREELVQWWYVSLPNALADLTPFEKIGEWCNAGPGGDAFRHDCFAGMGNYGAQYTGFSYEQTRKICEEYVPFQFRQDCLNEAASSFIVKDHVTNDACTGLGLTGELYTACVQHPRLGDD